MLDNIHYLKQSINSIEPFIDSYYVFTDWDKNIDDYIRETKELKDILTTIKTLKNKKILIDDSLYFNLIKLLNNYAKKSEFACFLTACDYNIENITTENIELVKKITDLFIEKRGICEFTHKEWLQAILDTGASRKKGKCGENKLFKIAKDYNYKQVENIDDFIASKKAVAGLANKEFSIKNIKKKLNVDLDFNNQNKVLDVLVKNEKELFFIEAKHIKIFGGEQNKQMLELINIIKKDTKNKNIHFVAFLDGIYSNTLLKDIFKTNNSNKLANQQKDIINALKLNKSNLWLNTNGFIELLRDLG